MTKTSEKKSYSALLSEEKAMIEEAWSLGHSEEKVSEDFGVFLEDIEEEFLVFAKEGRSHYDRLKEIVNSLERQCTLTERELQIKPTALMLQSYQRLMSEYRVSLSDMSDLKLPQDIVDDIMEKSFSPFITDLIRLCTEETNKLQQEMLKLNIPVRDAKGISTDIFSRLAERVQALLPQAMTSLDFVLGVKKSEADNRKAEVDADGVMQ